MTSLSATRSSGQTGYESRAATRDPALVKGLILGASLLFFAVFLLLPLVVVFAEALRKGWAAYVAALVEPDTLSSIYLTLIAAAIAVPLNLVFGVAAAWAIAKYEFRGKALLTTLIDLPFSVSPVIAGLIYVLVFGAQGWFGGALAGTGSRSSLRCRASCWRRFLSPFPSWRVNSFR